MASSSTPPIAALLFDFPFLAGARAGDSSGLTPPFLDFKSASSRSLAASLFGGVPRDRERGSGDAIEGTGAFGVCGKKPAPGSVFHNDSLFLPLWYPRSGRLALGGEQTIMPLPAMPVAMPQYLPYDQSLSALARCRSPLHLSQPTVAGTSSNRTSSLLVQQHCPLQQAQSPQDPHARHAQGEPRGASAGLRQQHRNRQHEQRPQAPVALQEEHMGHEVQAWQRFGLPHVWHTCRAVMPRRLSAGATSGGRGDHIYLSSTRSRCQSP